ncbi:DUF4129 domain-containing protein [Pseudoxanthomonas mexicana]|uniref:DUF4129 domain-containing protein n=1 Tax=Pseudoxanthomonas mexicana TaxID=128785 RepID=UPI00398ACE3B
MRLDLLTVQLRARSSWEAMELGMALVRRHAGTIWKSWWLATLPAFALANLAAVALGRVWLALLLMWWLKPLFDRIPLFVISRAVFGATPTVRETLRAQRQWGWAAMRGYLGWRRFGPVRALYLPIDLLEGGDAALRRERRGVLGGAIYGNAALLTLVCLHFEIVLLLACVMAVFLFVPLEMLSETARAAWSLISEQPPLWTQVGYNALAWLAVSVIEPFYVGAGFGLYLNRRTGIEAWDVEIAFRRLRRRLLSSTTALGVLLALAAGMPTGFAQAQERAQAPPSASTPPPQPRGTPPTLPIVFGDQRVDDGGFRQAVRRAYEDPLLGEKRSRTVWQARKADGNEQDDVEPPEWVHRLTGIVAFLGEWGLWLLAGLLVALLLATMRWWLPWMRGGGRVADGAPSEIFRHAVEPPEALPDDIAATAHRLWREGRPRDALALLYRASVEALGERLDAMLPPGATEAECLRASRRLPDADARELFARTVRTWQYAAYAQRLPADDEFEALLEQLRLHHRWASA